MRPARIPSVLFVEVVCKNLGRECFVLIKETAN